MATGDFADLKNRALYLARMNASSAVDLARAGEVLNEAYFIISDAGPRWEWLEVEGQFTVSTTNDKYTLASVATAIGANGIKEIYHMTNDTHSIGQLTRMSWRELEVFANSTQDDDPRGVVTSFAVFGSDFRVYPWPNATQTLGIIALDTVSEMTLDADTPNIPLTWRFRMLVPYAAARLLEQRGGGEAITMASRLQNEWNDSYEAFEARYASARYPHIKLDSHNVNHDLPMNTGGSYWYEDY